MGQTGNICPPVNVAYAFASHATGFVCGIHNDPAPPIVTEFVQSRKPGTDRYAGAPPPA